MGLPNINIAFKAKANETVRRSARGILAVILEDSTGAGTYTLSSAGDIPTALSALNKAYLERAFTGYINAPQKVLVKVLSSGETLSNGLDYMETQTFDYLCGPYDIDQSEAKTIADWIIAQRNDGKLYKAVVPNYTADSEGVINLVAEGVKAGSVSLSAAALCTRIAGMIAGTPLNISCTYAPLPEITEITMYSNEDLSNMIDAGKFVLYHDGEKVKIGRGVNSMTTIPAGKTEDYKKIKIVEAIDRITADLRLAAADNYIGKYANSYDNKCLLVSAVKGYFDALYAEGVIGSGYTAAIDIDAQRQYLASKGEDVSGMTEEEIKNANTGDKVFIAVTISILDAIEDISINIAM